MKPTNKLRFVERGVPAPEYGEGFEKTVRILQQWWEDGNTVLAVLLKDNEGNVLPSPRRGEWRDVPIEKAD
jgi:hypothetical protein